MYALPLRAEAVDERDRERSSDAERDPDGDPDQWRREQDGQPDERPEREREHECREAEAEQDAVQADRDGKRQDAPPVLRNLTSDLGEDRGVARLCDRGGERDDRCGERGVQAAGSADSGADPREERERDGSPGARSDRERDARCRCPSSRRADRVDDREATRGPRPGDARDERDQDQRHCQHGIFVS